MRIVILGAGFGGLSVARGLVRRGVYKKHEIVLVDKAQEFCYMPWLFHCAVGENYSATRRVKDFWWARHLRLVKEDVSGHSVQDRLVQFSSGGSLTYDVLIVALGAESRNFSLPGVSEYGLGLKNFSDAQRIAQRFAEVRHEALRSATPKHIFVVGAGANGVELCAEMASVLRTDDYVRLHLVDGAKEPVAMFPAAVRRIVQERLEKLRVRMLFSARLQSATPTSVSFSDITHPCDMLIFLGGVVAVRILSSFGLPLNPAGRIIVDNTFLVSGHSGIFALGDCAAMLDEGTGMADPQSAQAAYLQATYVARNVEAFLENTSPVLFPSRRRWQTLLVVGGKYGVGRVFGLAIWGYFAYVMRALVDKRFFLSLR